ncbi:MAG: TIM barrel protein [Alphaproteobacteria bacterium]|nr:TIM barrel protein [Alphaproteobacteria bacterium]
MTPTSRRSFLRGACAFGAASSLAGCMTAGQEAKAGPASSGKGFFASRGLPIGIQLYTLGDLIRTDLDGTLKKTAEIGYKTVEMAGYAGKTPAQLKTSFDAAGLSCTSAHVPIRVGTTEEPGLLGDLNKLADDMHTVGAKHVIAPALAAPTDITLTPPPEGAAGLARLAAAMTEDHWKRQAAQLNSIGAKLKTHDIAFGYHNHNIEFVTVNGRTGYEILLAETDPRFVAFEMDIGWVAAAGADLVQLFQKHSGRFGLAHLKDLKATTTPNFEFKMDPTEVGSGELDWARILPAAYKAGVRKFFVEQEAPFAFPRLESAEKCYAFLSTLKA